MLTLGIETIVVLLLIVGVVSAFGGYIVAHERQRRAGGGKTAAELKADIGEYKESVNEHFQTTANLLHDMTEQYRAVYEHMAAGAQNLCDPETAQSQIESLRAGLLPSAAAADELSAEPDEPDTSIAGEADDDANRDETTAAEREMPVAEPANDEEASGSEPPVAAVPDEPADGAPSTEDPRSPGETASEPAAEDDAPTPSADENDTPERRA